MKILKLNKVNKLYISYFIYLIIIICFIHFILTNFNINFTNSLIEYFSGSRRRGRGRGRRRRGRNCTNEESNLTDKCKDNEIPLYRCLSKSDFNNNDSKYFYLRKCQSKQKKRRRLTPRNCKKEGEDGDCKNNFIES